MAETLLVDYAWQHPNPAAIKAAGFVGVMRYLSADPTKNLSKAEAVSLHAAGLGIGLIWETSGGRAASGYSGGVADVRAAEPQADVLGFPRFLPIGYAVDYDADPSVILPYVKGVMAAARHPVAVYGSRRVCEAVRTLGVPYLWQCSAWSGTAVSSVANLYQRLAETHPISGTDENVMILPYPLWGVGPVPPVPPPPPPPHVVLLLLDGSMGGLTVMRWQQVMGTPMDGVISQPSQLIAAVQKFLGGLTPDGDLGPQTISRLQHHLGTSVDGTISLPISQVVRALQVALNKATTKSKKF
jgi:hypothetical protein